MRNLRRAQKVSKSFDEMGRQGVNGRMDGLPHCSLLINMKEADQWYREKGAESFDEIE
jgi:hypothetical protein